jgi:hypothetical protein
VFVLLKLSFAMSLRTDSNLVTIPFTFTDMYLIFVTFSLHFNPSKCRNRKRSQKSMTITKFERFAQFIPSCHHFQSQGILKEHENHKAQTICSGYSFMSSFSVATMPTFATSSVDITATVVTGATVARAARLRSQLFCHDCDRQAVFLKHRDVSVSAYSQEWR